MDNATIKIRTATIEDAVELLGIYAPYVEKTAITFEKEVPTVEEFAGRSQRIREKYPYLVAVTDDGIVGYAYAGAFKERAAYNWAVETSIYVAMDKKRMGIGTMLYEALEETLKDQNILNMNACIAYPQEEDEYLTKESAKFHEHLGYRTVGEFYQCGYKFHRWYNMIWMEKHIGEHVENQPEVRWFGEMENSRKC